MSPILTWSMQSDWIRQRVHCVLSVAGCEAHEAAMAVMCRSICAPSWVVFVSGWVSPEHGALFIDRTEWYTRPCMHAGKQVFILLHSAPCGNAYRLLRRKYRLIEGSRPFSPIRCRRQSRKRRFKPVVCCQLPVMLTMPAIAHLPDFRKGISLVQCGCGETLSS